MDLTISSHYLFPIHSLLPRRLFPKQQRTIENYLEFNSSNLLTTRFQLSFLFSANNWERRSADKIIHQQGIKVQSKANYWRSVESIIQYK